MQYLGSPTGLIVFAGEYLWPQLDAIAQWSDDLEEVCIVAAHGDEESGGPADRLSAFVSEFLPAARLRVLGPVHDDVPAESLAAIKSAATADRVWLLEASGGTRLMFAGALLACEHLPHLRVIFRDAPGPWYELLTAGGTRELEGTNPAAADRFTVESLIDVTWSDDERNARAVQADVEPEILSAAKQTLEGSDWRTAFDAAMERIPGRKVGGQSEGRLFERYVLSLVHGLGVQADDAALSAVLFDGLKALQEVDVVVNSNGRLHIIDCKLRESADALPIGVQIREAFTTRRHLGDGADQYILLRPNEVIAEEFRSLCRAYDIRVVDKQVLETEGLAEVLRRLIRPRTGPAGGPAPGPRAVRVPIVSSTMDLRSDFVQSREAFRIYDHGHVLVLAISPGRNVTVDEVHHAVARAVADKGTVLDVSRNSVGKSFTATVRPYNKQRATLGAELAGFDVTSI